MVNKVSKATKATIWAGIGLIIMMLALAGTELAHGATSAPRRGDNGLGVVLSDDNPYFYNMGMIAHGQVIEDGGHKYTSIDFAPFGKPLIFPEGILLCGDQADVLNAHHLKLVVLMYEKQAHTMYQGIGCHDLIVVSDVTLPKEQQ